MLNWKKLEIKIYCRDGKIFQNRYLRKRRNKYV
nr:MAG TPA: hypothetical protein [Caudoviricetes sp.]